MSKLIARNSILIQRKSASPAGYFVISKRVLNPSMESGALELTLRNEGLPRHESLQKHCAITKLLIISCRNSREALFKSGV